MQCDPRLLHRLADQLAQRAAVNTTDAPLSDALLHSLFAAQAAQHPRQPTVVAPDRMLTYQELERQANQVGHWLRAHGVKPNQLVAVVMDKGWQQVVAVLGVLAAGAQHLSSYMKGGILARFKSVNGRRLFPRVTLGVYVRRARYLAGRLWGKRIRHAGAVSAASPPSAPQPASGCHR